MQGLADGYFIIPYTIGNYLANAKPAKAAADVPAAKEAVANVDSHHQETTEREWHSNRGLFSPRTRQNRLGLLRMARNEAGLKKALTLIPALREDFWKNVRVLGTNEEFNQSLEKAGRVADFFELAELMCRDALDRNESCGGHFREEYQTPEGEALRDDANYSYVAAWEYQGAGRAPALNKEPLTFNYVKPSQRSYK